MSRYQCLGSLLRKWAFGCLTLCVGFACIPALRCTLFVQIYLCARLFTFVVFVSLCVFMGRAPKIPKRNTFSIPRRGDSLKIPRKGALPRIPKKGEIMPRVGVPNSTADSRGGVQCPSPRIGIGARGMASSPRSPLSTQGVSSGCVGVRTREQAQRESRSAGDCGGAVWAKVSAKSTFHWPLSNCAPSKDKLYWSSRCLALACLTLSEFEDPGSGSRVGC